MKHYNCYSIFAAALLCAGILSCCKADPNVSDYKMELKQPNTAVVVWNPADYDFKKGNDAILTKYGEMEKQILKENAGACSSWRNGSFHGRNLDWYQADYGCLIIQMPKGNGVKHASVALVNSNKAVTQEFIKAGKRKGFDSETSHNGTKRESEEPSEETRGKLYFWMKQAIDITKPKIFIAENVKVGHELR